MWPQPSLVYPLRWALSHRTGHGPNFISMPPSYKSAYTTPTRLSYPDTGSAPGTRHLEGLGSGMSVTWKATHGPSMFENTASTSVGSSFRPKPTHQQAVPTVHLETEGGLMAEEPGRLGFEVMLSPWRMALPGACPLAALRRAAAKLLDRRRQTRNLILQVGSDHSRSALNVFTARSGLLSVHIAEV